MAADSVTEYEPSYRERDVDETLDEHDGRIRRLEKAGLMAVGYGLAEGSNIATQVAGLIL